LTADAVNRVHRLDDRDHFERPLHVFGGSNPGFINLCRTGLFVLGVKHDHPAEVVHGR
jgi:hypothetical protein